jgi:hypothetical protein
VQPMGHLCVFVPMCPPVIDRRVPACRDGAGESPPNWPAHAAGGKAALAGLLAATKLSPKVPEPIRCQLSITNRVLDVLVAEPSLLGAGIVTGIS